MPLAPLTTLGVGGPARWFVDATEEATATAALAWARTRGVRVHVLGGGSNLVVGDAGVDGLVLRIALRGVDARDTAAGVEVAAAAGEPWDALVAHAVARGWAGVECLSGIPGLVGATPIQNVGAYGQDVAETITAVRAIDTRTARVVSLDAGACRFAYRDSVFRSGERGRFVVLGVTYRLSAGGAPAVRYAELERALAARGIARPTLADVRDAVLAVRRAKSMVLEPGDPNRRSCGSFFVNPVVDAAVAAAVAARVAGPDMPAWPERDGRVKLSAAWLIERAGFARGHRVGRVGLSTRHTLALVAHDDATAAEVVAFARTIQAEVAGRLGVQLTPEPDFWTILPA